MREGHIRLINWQLNLMVGFGKGCTFGNENIIKMHTRSGV